MQKLGEKQNIGDFHSGSAPRHTDHGQVAWVLLKSTGGRAPVPGFLAEFAVLTSPQVMQTLRPGLMVQTPGALAHILLSLVPSPSSQVEMPFIPALYRTRLK